MASVQGTPSLRYNINILIADDHALLRRGLKEFLRDFLVEDGFAPRFMETGCAQDAIAQMRAATWDLVILDLNLPDMPGLEVLRIAKSIQPSAPVLVVSIYAEEHYASRAVRAGARGYLTKDTGPEELRLAVSRLLQGEPFHRPDAGSPHKDNVSDQSSLRTDALPAPLSDREFEVLQCIAQGRRLTDIAEQLNLSIKTVSTYRTRLLMKLGLKTTAELVRYALDQQLV
jgi:two-component system invasion response regulator UvrY